MSKKIKKRQQQSPAPGQRPWLWVIVGALLLVVAGGLIFWNSADTAPAVAPEVTGKPKLAVDQTTIDEGYQKYNAPVETAFRLRNVGDQPLKILGEPQVVLAEGC